MLRHIVEGWSDESYEEAIFDALKRAEDDLRKLRNAHVHISTLNMTEDERYHAVLEVTTEPMGHRKGLDVIGQFKEVTRAHDLSFRLFQRAEHDHIHQIVSDHLLKMGKTNSAARPIPDFILVPLGTDAYIEGHMLEHEFFDTAHSHKPHKPKPIEFAKDPSIIHLPLDSGGNLDPEPE